MLMGVILLCMDDRAKVKSDRDPVLSTRIRRFRESILLACEDAPDEVRGAAERIAELARTQAGPPLASDLMLVLAWTLPMTVKAPVITAKAPVTTAAKAVAAKAIAKSTSDNVSTYGKKTRTTRIIAGSIRGSSTAFANLISSHDGTLSESADRLRQILRIPRSRVESDVSGRRFVVRTEENE